MSDLADSFAKLIGRKPTDAEIQQLYRVRDALGIQNNDALFLVLMSLQYYQTSYQEFPKKIADAASYALREFKETAHVVAQMSLYSAQADLAKAVEIAAHQVARDVSGTQKLRWLCLSLTICLVGFSTFGYFMRQNGITHGYDTAYRHAFDEKAAASWANTPEGHTAFRFSKTQSWGHIINCDSPGWTVRGDYCVPYASGTTTYGWPLPK